MLHGSRLAPHFFEPIKFDNDDDDNNIYSGTSNSAVAGLSGALTK